MLQARPSGLFVIARILIIKLSPWALLVKNILYLMLLSIVGSILERLIYMPPHLARKIKKPLIATADLHRLEYLNGSYALIDCVSLDVPSVFEAIRQGRFENFSQPQSGWGMIIYFLSLMFANPLRSIKKFF